MTRAPRGRGVHTLTHLQTLVLVHKYAHIVHAHAHICTQCHTPVACINTRHKHKAYVHTHIYTHTCSSHLQDSVFNISGRDSSRKLPRYTLITVEMDESVRYLRRRVSIISRLDRHRATFTRVAQFRVYNRVTHHRSFTSYFQGTLRGYGEYHRSGFYVYTAGAICMDTAESLTTVFL